MALAQAAAYIRKTGETLTHYHELFSKSRGEMWKREEGPAGRKRTVAITFGLAIEQAATQEPAAADLLNLCAFLAPDDIRRYLLLAWMKRLNAEQETGTSTTTHSADSEQTNALRLNDALAALRAFSLIDIDGDLLSVHRLVQAVCRDNLRARDAMAQWAETALRIVNDTFPFDVLYDPNNWPRCGQLLTHALASAQFSEQLSLAPDTTSRLLNQLGLYQHTRAQFADAKATFKRAIEIAEKAYGPEHPQVAIRVNNLGGVLYRLGDLDGARKHFERALRIDEKIYGLEHTNVAIRVNNLGSVLKALGDLDGARKYFERALRIDEKVLGRTTHKWRPMLATSALCLRTWATLPWHGSTLSGHWESVTKSMVTSII